MTDKWLVMHACLAAAWLVEVESRSGTSPIHLRMARMFLQNKSLALAAFAVVALVLLFAVGSPSGIAMSGNTNPRVFCNVCHTRCVYRHFSSHTSCRLLSCCYAVRSNLLEAFAGNTAGLESFHGSYAKLSSGHDIPLLGWGSFQASADETEVAVQEALHAGFRVRATCYSEFACLVHPFTQQGEQSDSSRTVDCCSILILPQLMAMNKE